MEGSIPNDQQFDVAIVGGGIIGLVLTLGLVKRNVKVKIYEQARSFREIGAGVVFSGNAIRCFNILDSRIVDALKIVATANGDPNNPTDYLQWTDGYSYDKEDPSAIDDKLLFKLYAGAKGFEGCHRAHFLDELIKFVPDGVVEFNKRFDSFVERSHDTKVMLRFSDGSTAEADAVIGCDGIKSRVRECLFGEGNPASYPHFSHKVAFRGLVPMAKAEAAVGTYKARNQHMHLGPNAHMLHFPVAKQALMNVVAFVSHPQDWQNDKTLTAAATKAEVVEAFAGWGPTVRAIIDLLPDALDKWAIYDTHDYPAPTYAKGCICIAGDAAHASSPHQGAGAGVGVEDALALAALLEIVTAKLKTPGIGKMQALSSAFNTYDAVRRERTQWLVSSSRHICDTYEWANPETGNDPVKCFDDIKWRYQKVWCFDEQTMLHEVPELYERLLVAGGGNLQAVGAGETIKAKLS